MTSGMMTGAGMGWMMGGMALIWVLTLVALILGIAALIKFLRT
jgi:hypothetical protein